MKIQIPRNLIYWTSQYELHVLWLVNIRMERTCHMQCLKRTNHWLKLLLCCCPLCLSIVLQLCENNGSNRGDMDIYPCFVKQRLYVFRLWHNPKDSPKHIITHQVVIYIPEQSNRVYKCLDYVLDHQFISLPYRIIRKLNYVT